MENWRDYYQILGVDPGANAEELKDAYRFRCQTMHPDKVPKRFIERANDELKRVNEAYDILKDPEKRRKYDAEWLQRRDTPPTAQEPKPRPIVTPPLIEFSDVPTGEVQTASFIVQNEGGPYEKIRFSNPDSWVQITDYHSIDPSDELPLQIDLDP